MDNSESENYESMRGKLSKVPSSVDIAPDVRIELVTEFHGEELFHLTDNNRLYLKEWLPWLDSCTRKSDTLKFIQNSKAALCEGVGLTFVMFHSRKMAGTISFNKVDWISRRAEIGYWIGETFQGFGIVTSTCSALIDIAFRSLDLEEVCISCASGNTRSQRIPIRLGFKEMKLIPKKENLYGIQVDHKLYTLKKSQWVDTKKSDS